MAGCSRLVSANIKFPAVYNNYFSQRNFVTRRIQKEDEYKLSYQLLKIDDDSDQETVRRAFVKLVKRYHPDSDSPEASVEKFQQIENAYRKLQTKFANERHSRSCEGEYGLFYDATKHKQPSDVKEFDIKHTAPQHRQYLSFDGQGIGTPSERQKQHIKLRASKAIENVYDHRVNKLQSAESLSVNDSLIVQDKKKSKNIKTRYGMERLVEDLIQEAMARGDFDNLTGKGKPLKQYNEYNPYVDFVTHKMNQILIDNGFMPEWITLQKEIKEEVDHVRSVLAKERVRFGSLPLSQEDEEEWHECINKLKEVVSKLNKKIEKFNLVVPILNKQLLQFNLEKESKKILVEGKIKETATISKVVASAQTEDKNRKNSIFTFLNSVFQRI